MTKLNSYRDNERISRRNCMRFLGGLLCSVLVSAVLPADALQSLTLDWNPSMTTNVIGYNIYYGVTNGAYTNELHAGNTTNLTISGLVNGTTYYFAVTSLNNFGVQSSFSGQFSYTIPAAAALGAPAYSGNKFSFTITGTPGHSYALQTSTNLLDWTSLQTNTSPWIFSDTNSQNFHQRFYRSVYPP